MRFRNSKINAKRIVISLSCCILIIFFPFVRFASSSFHQHHHRKLYKKKLLYYIEKQTKTVESAISSIVFDMNENRH